MTFLTETALFLCFWPGYTVAKSLTPLWLSMHIPHNFNAYFSGQAKSKYSSERFKIILRMATDDSISQVEI